MRIESFRNLGIAGKLLMLFFVLFLCLIIGLVVVFFAFGSSNDIQTIKINQLILSVFMLLLPAIICGYLWYENPWKSYSLHKLPSSKLILLSIILILCISPFINLLGHINEQIKLPEFLAGVERRFMEMEDSAKELTDQMLAVNTFSGLLFNLLVIAVMPAVGEELICRGTLLNIFSEKRNKHAAIWIVAVIFSLIHFQMYGFLPRMVLGALLGYLLVWSGSLWLPILVHFVNNATIVLAFYFGRENGVMDVMENLGKAETWGYGIASAVVSGVIIWWMVRTAANSKLETEN
ncbi:MAG: CPBP family intramembrane metalloprotease [Bacteroidales bacterium]|nr:CPBP family intramembrane metalloprotease [Bacteroidales bacterium]